MELGSQMGSDSQRKEKDVLQILKKYFCREYFCKEHSFEKIGGSHFEFDLYCQSKSDSQEFIIIDIKIVALIHDYNIRNFVLTRNQYNILATKSSKNKFYLCIDAASKLTRRAKQLLDTNTIGLIRVNDDSVKSIADPESVERKLQKIITSLEKSKDFEEEKKARKEYYTNLINQLTSEIIEFKDKSQNVPIYKLRISAELIAKLENLSRVGYSSLLIEFAKKYKNIENQQDENNLILKTLRNLWEGKYGKTQGAKAFTSFEKFEPILKDTPRYRDHMVHPFQVFLMGSLIIDNNYDFFTSTHKRFFEGSATDSLEFAWLMCSTFHDICYPIQKYEEINKNLFRDFLGSESPPIVFQAEKLLFENDNLNYLDQLIALYDHYLKRGSTWKFGSPCCIDQTLRSGLIEEISKRNHGLLSSIALIKKTLSESFVQKNLEEYAKGRFSTDIYPAALAIALHDEDVLNRIKSKISIDIMPLCFLLVYCDLVQECGPTDSEEIVELHGFVLNGNNIESTLTFANEGDYDNKIKEMKRIYKKFDKELNSSNFNFKLSLIYDG